MPQSDSGHLAGRGATADGPWWPWHRTLGSGPDCHGAQRPGEAPLSLASLLWTRVMNRISGYQARHQGLNCDSAQLPSGRQARRPGTGCKFTHFSQTTSPSFPVFTGKIRVPTG